MSTAIIAEDETPQREALRSMLSESWPQLQIVAECADGLAALEALAKHRPQVVFLDIRMPGVGGLAVARAASGNAQIVFTTAYEEYALKAFDHGALDYLLKPIRRERLDAAVHRLRERLNSGAAPEVSAALDLMEQKLAELAPREYIKWITASAGNTTKMFAIDEVLFFQALEKYTRVVTLADEAFIRTPLKDLLAGLDPEAFWQIHRSAIVRANAIQSVSRNEEGKFTLRVKGRSESLPVSSAIQHRFRGM